MSRRNPSSQVLRDLERWARAGGTAKAEVLARLGGCALGSMFAAIAQAAVAEAHGGEIGGIDHGSLTDTARADLESALARRLHRLAAPTLVEDQELFEAARAPLALLLHEDDASSYSRAIESGDWPSPFRGAPAIVDILVRTVRDEIAALRRMFLRLSADRPRLRLPPDAQVCGVARDVADFHQGDAVTVLNFPTATWVYKPRDQAAAVLYSELVGRLVQEGLSLCAPRAVTGEGYGWAEFIPEVRGPLSRSGWARVYGQTIAVAYAIGLHDLHHENVIFSACGPVVIDVETLLAPVHAFSGDVISLAAVEGEVLGDSVTDTGLLARWEVLPKDCLVDVSPLAAGFADNADAPWAGSAAQAFCSLPRENRAAQIAEIGRGFEEAWSVLCRLRSVLVARLQAAHLQTRIVLRPTHFYTRVLEASLHPQCCGSSQERRAFIYQTLAPEPHALDNRRWHRDLAEYETDALLAGQIPIFYAQTDGLDLLSRERAVATSFFKRTGAGGVAARFAALDECSLARQRELLRHSFALRFDGATLYERAANELDADALDPLSWTLNGIVSDLRRTAIAAPGASPDWYSAGLPDAAGRLTYAPLDSGLYSGRCGLLAFLDVYGRLEGDAWATTVASQFRASLVESAATAEAAEAVVGLHGIGAAYGAGGLLYTLALTAEVPNDGAAHAVANLVSALDRSDIAHQPLELLAGTAGLVIGLLAAHDRFGNPDALALAQRAGTTMARELERVMVVYGPEALPPGMAHGALGMALALDRLCHRAPDQNIEAATEALFIALASRPIESAAAADADAGPGPGLGLGQVNLSWCWGLAGAMHLAGAFRRRGLESKTVASGQAMIDDILERRAPQHRVDHLCCGTTGLIDALIDFGAVDAAQRVAEEMLVVRKRRGGFRFFPGERVSLFNASLFRGLAGVGYVLLRLKYPGRVPSVAGMALVGGGANP